MLRLLTVLECAVLATGFAFPKLSDFPLTKVKIEPPADFIIPEPKPLTLTRPENLGDVLKSSVGLGLRLGTGAFVLGWQVDTLSAPEDDKYALSLGGLRVRDSSSVLDSAPRPKKNLILYEYESCPYCKKVREAINVLDLSVEMRPCPGAKEGKFSDELFEKTGRRTVPYLIDPNANTEMFESGDIINYLADNYGPADFDRKAFWPITFDPFSVPTSGMTALVRGFPAASRATNARPENESVKPLELWGYECSPFVRPVREKLSELALPHVFVSCSRGSANRNKLMERTGRFQVPYLVDPNTGLEFFESPEIVDYLEAVYTQSE